MCLVGLTSIRIGIYGAKVPWICLVPFEVTESKEKSDLWHFLSFHRHSDSAILNDLHVKVPEKVKILLGEKLPRENLRKSPLDGVSIENHKDLPDIPCKFFIFTKITPKTLKLELFVSLTPKLSEGCSDAQAAFKRYSNLWMTSELNLMLSIFSILS